jgi:dTDP-4-dehydrorhamnose 3,5-epimerase/CDP-3, 6-dideoxy-D-glycero-D-glycero-4-hexulose-5-epimerase
MEIIDTSISGLKIIELKKFNDIRGSFLKVFNEDFFSQNGFNFNYKESYFSVSHKNVIRGMHFQVPPFDNTKLVYLNIGKILDVVLDLRMNSPSYGKHFSIELDTNTPVIIYIPNGCAHGFLSLQDYTTVTYLQSSCYNKVYDKGIKYDS